MGDQNAKPVPRAMKIEVSDRLYLLHSPSVRRELSTYADTKPLLFIKSVMKINFPHGWVNLMEHLRQLGLGYCGSFATRPLGTPKLSSSETRG